MLAKKCGDVEALAGSNVKVLDELAVRRFQFYEVSKFARLVLLGTLVEVLNDEGQVPLRLRVVRKTPFPRATKLIVSLS